MLKEENNMAEIINETEQEIFADDLPVEEDEELAEEELINLFGVMPDEGDTAPVTHGWEESV
jgi:hypothetical protein